MTITIPMFVFTLILPIYLGIGLVLYLPAEYHAWKNVHRPGPFWLGLWRGLKRHPHIPLLFVVAWPYFAYNEFVR